MESKLLIHQISKEIIEIETENENLKRLLVLNITRNIEYFICLNNGILHNQYKQLIGEINFVKIHKLIENQVYNKLVNYGIFFEWQGDISFKSNKGLIILDTISELNEVLENINI